MKNFSLEGKRILVTGASSGIGRACAICAAEMGAEVVLTGRRADALDETVKMIVSATGLEWRARGVTSTTGVGLEGRAREVTSTTGDIGDVKFVKELVEKVGKIDGLVHAAGVCNAMPIGVVDEKLLMDSMKVNYFAFMELMKYYSKKKFANEGFSAVAVSSVSAEVGWAGGALYSGSKGALSAAVRALALELAPKGIRVNAVCPSNIRTPMFDQLAGAMCDEAVIKAKQPLGIGEPEQVAGPVCFLLSDAASFVTGVNLPVDGGYLAQ